MLNSLICKVENENAGFKKLMLTNKSISIEVGFKYLYDMKRKKTILKFSFKIILCKKKIK